MLFFRFHTVQLQLGICHVCFWELRQAACLLARKCKNQPNKPAYSLIFHRHITWITPDSLTIIYFSFVTTHQNIPPINHLLLCGFLHWVEFWAATRLTFLRHLLSKTTFTGNYKMETLYNSDGCWSRRHEDRLNESVAFLGAHLKVPCHTTDCKAGLWMHADSTWHDFVWPAGFDSAERSGSIYQSAKPMMTRLYEPKYSLTGDLLISALHEYGLPGRR